ncbi:EAL domain-containing protein [Billgrantia montanilacus]|uniref:EAL domain-containing protein n=1 Tax=Billgrantia montanilacus TaxID=2282305 RepID=UPI003BEEF8D1
MKVITEGVEQAAQVEWLRQEGCHVVQGYYYGKPMPSCQLESLFRERKRPRKL